MEIQYRKLTPEESNVYREIRLECLKNFPLNFCSEYHSEKQKKKLFFQTHIENSNPDIFMIGAFNDRKLIGIAGFSRHSDTKTNHRGRIIQVYVRPGYQGKNIGFNILAATLKEAFELKGIEQIEIEVLTSNVKAENLYRKIGFQECGLHENFLKIDNDYFDHKMMVIFKDQYVQENEYYEF